MSTITEGWLTSKKGNQYQVWDAVPAEIRNQLKQEDKFGVVIGEFEYSVKRTDDGKFIVFKNTPRPKGTRTGGRRSGGGVGYDKIDDIILVPHFPDSADAQLEANKLAKERGFRPTTKVEKVRQMDGSEKAFITFIKTVTPNASG